MTIVGFTCSAFDLLHTGHLYFLKECKKQCDFLIVGLHTNPTIDRSTKNIPTQSIYERWYALNSINHIVDQIIPYDTEHDLKNMLWTLDINVRFLGSDYLGMAVTGHDVCRDKNIPIIYIPRNHDYSTSSLKARIQSEITPL